MSAQRRLRKRRNESKSTSRCQDSELFLTASRRAEATTVLVAVAAVAAVAVVNTSGRRGHNCKFNEICSPIKRRRREATTKDETRTTTTSATSVCKYENMKVDGAKRRRHKDNDDDDDDEDGVSGVYKVRSGM